MAGHTATDADRNSSGPPQLDTTCALCGRHPLRGAAELVTVPVDTKNLLVCRVPCRAQFVEGCHTLINGTRRCNGLAPLVLSERAQL